MHIYTVCSTLTYPYSTKSHTHTYTRTRSGNHRRTDHTKTESQKEKQSPFRLFLSYLMLGGSQQSRLTHRLTICEPRKPYSLFQVVFIYSRCNYSYQPVCNKDYGLSFRPNGTCIGSGKGSELGFVVTCTLINSDLCSITHILFKMPQQTENIPYVYRNMSIYYTCV